MRGKRSLWIPLTAIMIVAIIPLIPGVQAEETYGTIALSPPSVSWTVGEEPTQKQFTLEVKVTNVTNIVAACFSLHWDPSVLDLLTVSQGDCLEMTDAEIGAGGGGTFWTTPKINHTEGDLHEAAYTQLATYFPRNFTDPDWGLLATLTFSFIGTPPAVGFPIDEYINFTNYDTTEMMSTYWAEKQEPSTPVKNTFSVVTPCHFHYEAVETITHEILVDSVVYNVVTTSSSNVSDVSLNITEMELSFNVTGQEGTTGFCNVTIPKNLLNIGAGESWVALIDGEEVSFVLSENTTHTFLYFTYTHSTHKIQIRGTWVVPEFSAPTLLMTLLIVALAIAILAKRAPLNKRRHL